MKLFPNQVLCQLNYLNFVTLYGFYQLIAHRWWYNVSSVHIKYSFFNFFSVYSKLIESLTMSCEVLMMAFAVCTMSVWYATNSPASFSGRGSSVWIRIFAYDYLMAIHFMKKPEITQYKTECQTYKNSELTDTSMKNWFGRKCCHKNKIVFHGGEITLLDH